MCIIVSRALLYSNIKALNTDFMNEPVHHISSVIPVEGPPEPR